MLKTGNLKEENKMCKCLENVTKDLTASYELIGNKLYVESWVCQCGRFEDIIEINYCPICGEKIKEEK